MNILYHDHTVISSNEENKIKKFIKWMMGIGIFLTLGALLIATTQLLEVTSESLRGIRYLLIYKSSSFKRGDIVSIHGHHPHYVGDHIFTKRIVGAPGDYIKRTKKGLEIKASHGAFTTTFPLLQKTKEGQVLTPLSLQVIPEGYLFVVGDHLRSFDSRYEEFGLVPIDKVWGKGLLWW